MKKISFIALILVALVSSSFATWKINPFTGKLDYYEAATSASWSTITNFPVDAVGDILVVTSLTPTTFGVISKPTTSNWLFGVNSGNTLGYVNALNIMLSTSNTTTTLNGILTATSGGNLSSSTNLTKDAIDFANLVSTGSTTISVYVPWAGTITSSNIVCQATSTISAAIYTAPTNTDVFTLISASAPVTMSGAAYEAPDTTLTGWTTSFSAGTYFRAVFNSMTGGPCSIGLGVTKTN